VLLVLAFDALRYYKINFSVFSRRTPPVAEEAPK
jgi:hypothetical protein